MTRKDGMNFKVNNEELKDKKEFLTHIKDLEKDKSTITLVYGAKDEEHNNAVVLRDVLKEYK